MSTSSKAQAAAEPLENGKGMTGSSGSEEGGTKYGSGGGNAPNPGQGHGPAGGKDKKEQGPKG